MKENKTYYESGHALCWIEFDEQGCPLTEKDAEKEYFLSEKDILGLDIVLDLLKGRKERVPYSQEHNNGCNCPTVCKHECNDKCKV